MKRVHFEDQLTEIDNKRQEIKLRENKLKKSVKELSNIVNSNEEFYHCTRQKILTISTRIYNLICECNDLSRPKPNLDDVNILTPRKKKTENGT